MEQTLLTGKPALAALFAAFSLKQLVCCRVLFALEAVSHDILTVSIPELMYWYVAGVVYP
jgi:hypothetical protein